MTFRALILNEDLTTEIRDLADDTLPAGDVTVGIEYSTVNFKDGLCLTGQRGMVQTFPHVAGSTSPAWWSSRAIRATPPATAWC